MLTREERIKIAQRFHCDTPAFREHLDEGIENSIQKQRETIEGNYRRMVRDMRKSGLIPKNARGLATLGERAKQALA